MSEVALVEEGREESLIPYVLRTLPADPRQLKRGS